MRRLARLKPGPGALALGAAAWLACTGLDREPHFDGHCTQVSGVAGPEDITIDAHSGVAYVSATDRRAQRADEPFEGSLYAYDLGAESPELVDLTPDAPPDFAPHGISLSADGRTLLAINHGHGRHAVEVYDVVDGALVHRATRAGPALVSPNDVAAVDGERFYVANDHGRGPGLRRALDDLLRRPTGSVVYYDGAGFREVVSRVPYANGIQVTPDGARVYLMALLAAEIRVYRRDPATGALDPEAPIPIGTSGDNLELDARGRIWVAAHPSLFRFLRHALDAGVRAPSQVLRVTPETGAVEEIYLEAGLELSGSSVAAVRGDRMLIGAVFEPHFLDCRLAGAGL